MTSQELIVLCGAAWAVAAIVLIAMDFLGTGWPKRRFQPRGWYAPRSWRERVGFRRKVRTVQDEQVRQVLEQATGRPTLALSSKRLARVQNREDVLAVAVPAAEAAASTDRSEAWRRLVESGWDRANRDRLRAGLPPQRWNPIRGSLETAEILDDGTDLTVEWPNPV